MSAPSAPRIQASPVCGLTTIKFFWDSPASGAPLEKYTLACSAMSYTQDVSGDMTDFTVTGLTAGTEYDFTITATNATGTGPAAAFPRVAAGVRPFGPSEATASTVNTTTALVTWTPSTIANEAPTRWYILTAQPSTAGASTLIKTEYAFRTSTFFKGLSTNVYYRFLVQGVGAPGYCIPFAYTSTLGFGITTAAFSPSSLTGMALWLDANSSNNFTLTGSNITTWIDRSANAYTATKAGSPSLILSTSAVHFASGSYLGIPDAAPLRLQTSSFSIYGVYRTVPTGQTQFLMSKFVDGGSYNGWNLRAAQNGGGSLRPVWYAGGTPDYVITSTPIVDGSYRTLSMYQYYSTLQTFVDGGLESTIQTTTPTNATVPLNIGVRQTDGSSPFNGSVREIIMYSNAITPFDRQKVEGYLAWKWGMQAQLPAPHPFKLAAPTATSGFSPSSFSGLQLWYDAADPYGTGTVPANGTSVSTIYDKSSNSRNASTSVAASAVLQTNSQNALPTFYFNGAKSYVTPYTSFPTSYTIFSLFKTTSNTGADGGYQRFLTGSNDYYVFVGVNNSNLATFVGNGGWNDTVVNTPNFNASNTYALLSLTNNAATLTPYVYGSNQNTKVGTTGSFNNLIFGSLNNASQWFIGNMAETLIFNRVLSTDDRQTVEGYLAWKWGLQGNLPTTHPYKFLSPASNYNAAVVPQGLLVRFDATTYSGSGAWANTASLGANNNATVESGTFSKNAVGNGVVFNGSNNFTFSNIAVGNAWSVSLWLKRTGVGDQAASWLTQNYSGTSMNLGIYTNDSGTGVGNDQIIGSFFTGDWRRCPPTTLTLNAWIHITYTWNGTTMIGYSNAVSTATSTLAFAATDAGNAYRIGRRWDGTGYVRGEIGQILIYNRAITESEALQNYAATSSIFSV